jgi:hypothetical protein
MTDDLDREALAYMQERNPSFNDRPFSYNPQPQSGGKIRTAIPKKEKMARDKTYISDEPERFEQYIEDIKPTFTDVDTARDRIIQKWTRDSSLSNLLKGLENAGVLERELNSLINLESVKRQMADVQVAKRLRLSPKRFRKNIMPFVISTRLTDAFMQIQRDRRATINVLDLVRPRQSGTIRGQTAEGRATTHRLGRSQIVVYRDNKGRFIKVR